MKPTSNIAIKDVLLKLAESLAYRNRIREWNKEKQKEILLQRYREIMKGRDLVITDNGYRENIEGA